MRGATKIPRVKLTLMLERDLIKALKHRAVAEGTRASALVATWIRTWKERQEGKG